MPAIRSAQITAFFLFDVAEGADLPPSPACSAAPAPSRLAPRPAMPGYVHAPSRRSRWTARRSGWRP